MSPFSKRIGVVAIATVLIVGSFISGAYYTRRSYANDASASISGKTLGKPQSVDFAAFWEAWNILEEHYVPTKKGATSTPVTDEDKIWGAIKGLAESYGDPYTTFFPPVQATEFKEEISGAFEGLGIEVGVRDGILTVISPLKGTPADKAGLRPGDKILKIDDTLTVDLSTDEAIRMMRGKKGTSVRLTLLSVDATEPREVTVVRDAIAIPTIDTEHRKDGVFIISLYNFSANSAQLFRGAIEEFKKSGSSKLVIDLRGNPGGYLDAAVDMASWFLPKDKVVLREDVGSGEEKVHYSKGYNIFNNNLKVVILGDGGSASASEILAGALTEHGVATLVGTKTYGKGSVQELINLTSDTALKITIARWLTPNGNSISEQGLKPAYEVPRTQEDRTAGKDPQLDKAVEILLKP
ncbi:MAG: S41 family peptidase [bacterium]|nr:S41 family peptidase [bacterium]